MPGVGNGIKFSERPGLERNGRLAKEALDLELHLIRQFSPGAVEKLNAIVVVAVVRCADDDAQAGVETLSKISDAGRWQWH